MFYQPVICDPLYKKWLDGKDNEYLSNKLFNIKCQIKTNCPESFQYAKTRIKNTVINKYCYLDHITDYEKMTTNRYLHKQFENNHFDITKTISQAKSPKNLTIDTISNLGRSSYSKKLELRKINEKNEIIQQRIDQCRSYYGSFSKTHKKKSLENYSNKKITNLKAKLQHTIDREDNSNENNRDAVKNKTSYKISENSDYEHNYKKDLKFKNITPENTNFKILYKRKAFMTELLLCEICFYLDNKK